MKLGLNTNSRRERALTVIELMVSVTLMSFIILALYQMFAKTQEQMRRAINQVDTLESGRAVMKQIQRDLGLAAYPEDESTNITFYWSLDWSTNQGIWGMNMVSPVNPAISNRNQYDRMFLTTFNHSFAQTNWGGVGYHIGSPHDPWAQPTNGFGTLYRFNFNTNFFLPAIGNTFRFSSSTNFMSRLIDNVVHFRVRPFPTTSVVLGGPSGNYLDSVNAQMFCYTNQALPRMVEVELGYLDQESASQALAFENAQTARNYLAQRPERVTFFRFLVPIQLGSQ
ncbi:MAG: PilW family protein [Limisphaerales bacterium]